VLWLLLTIWQSQWGFHDNKSYLYYQSLWCNHLYSCVEMIRNENYLPFSWMKVFSILTDFSIFCKGPDSSWDLCIFDEFFLGGKVCIFDKEIKKIERILICINSRTFSVFVQKNTHPCILHQTEVHLKDWFYFCNLNSTLTYPSFKSSKCTGFIHMWWF
jgi:hypothetical protein